jgi:hypothetical protein
MTGRINALRTEGFWLHGHLRRRSEDGALAKKSFFENKSLAFSEHIHLFAEVDELESKEQREEEKNFRGRICLSGSIRGKRTASDERKGNPTVAIFAIAETKACQTTSRSSEEGDERGGLGRALIFNLKP